MKNLSTEDKISLVTGKGMWHTAPVDGLPSVVLSDGPNGLRTQSEEAQANNDSIPATCFPTEATLACSWNPDCLAKVADAIANESIENDVSIVLGPGVNIKRSPFGGRNFEYLSEDPYLAGKLAVAYIRAMEARGVGTSLKHFAGNSQERFRMTSNSEIDERTLHEIYLRAFEIAVKEGKPATVMASYNRLNGTYSTENRELLTDILWKEWGYQGAVVSDWGACTDLVRSILAGMDLEMPDSVGFHRSYLENVAEHPEVKVALDRASSKVTALVEKYRPGAEGRAVREIDSYAVAEEAALESAVLMQNDGILPLLDSTKKLFPDGPLCEKVRIQGGGSSHVNAKHKPDMKAVVGQKYRIAENISEADIVLFFGGLDDKTEGEGFDRTSYELPEEQVEEMETILQTGKKAVFIAFGGSPFFIPFREKWNAILFMGLPGEAADFALVKLLSGEVSPSGKLAETWPMSYADVPCHDTFAGEDRNIHYSEKIFVGYRYYDTKAVPVQYSFGYGLSYSEFAYSSLSVEKKDGEVSVHFRLKNTGQYDAAEIVEVYVKNPEGEFPREKRSLRGFQKVFLKTGQEAEVDIGLDDRCFQIFHDGQFAKAKGTYEIEVGSSLQDIRLSEMLEVSEGEAFTAADFPEEPWQDFSYPGRGSFDKRSTIREMKDSSPLIRLLLGLVKAQIKKIFPGRDMDDPEVQMFLEGLMDGPIEAVAIQSEGLISQKLMQALLLDANGYHFRALAKMIGGRKA
ncbi:MAG: glycoside hydrolase family 3 C-terminal domain-containing protein [Erysipelotrichaceae bacterium]|jgi:beta-glucosidase|nr:glycoside hydrolase family 3 C-terminal domain-containing protein [Erysipelotrichaceae bacterium]MDD6361725.1 glycoside hydrolase family 3 C-terminal domain-containing protein [Lachnospiraceae bacterium]MDD6448799.1 glycoside hydrolase family 3 C-terminal domain-containing protein [Lachnospiraceae bacterium]MDD6450314.1 glycoside hydrolase family 3 C-terminal domain-containing protein [Lachnospiraceae bacterium]MDD6578732.1 glycoside hydrolase family 3 C-terminal domain-containing protein [L